MTFFTDPVFGDIGLLVLRVGIGSVFLVHGIMKWGMWKPQGPGTSANMTAMMRFLSIVEPLGAVAVLLGFLTPIAAVGLSVIMMGAMYLKRTAWKLPFTTMTATGWELDFLLLTACLCIALSGAGTYSLDVALRIF